MDVFLIWYLDPQDEQYVSVVAAWDEYTIEGNNDGWLEEIAKAEQEYGARHLRITKTHVSEQLVRKAFAVTEI